MQKENVRSSHPRVRASSSPHAFRIAAAAMIAALYTALTVALAPISYGLVQVRVSEALTLLPVYSPAAVWGVGAGCLLSNIIGLAMGVNILGPLDILFGTAATVAAALASRALRRRTVRGLPVLAALPPIVANALVVGAELYYVATPGAGAAAFLVQAGWVALGEGIACIVLGLPLCRILQRTGLAGLLEASAGPRGPRQ